MVSIQAFKHTDDFGGELGLGTYVSGEGTFDSDPMVRSWNITCESRVF